jgi:dethiobiotin synthetase
MNAVFVTATDTDAGKTIISLGLIHSLRRKGLRVAGMKPVAAGAMQHGDDLQNEDAQLLRQADSLDVPYRVTNPYIFEPAIAPHIAAAEADVRIDLNIISERFDRLRSVSDFVVVEGAGGWRVPLDSKSDMSEIPRQLGLPVVLVVGMRLGCLNHALLTVEAVERDGLPLVGWIANQVDPGMSRQAQNLQTLQDRIDAPCLGVVPFLPELSAQSVASCLDTNSLMDTA